MASCRSAATATHSLPVGLFGSVLPGKASRFSRPNLAGGENPGVSRREESSLFAQSEEHCSYGISPIDDDRLIVRPFTVGLALVRPSRLATVGELARALTPIPGSDPRLPIESTLSIAFIEHAEDAVIAKILHSPLLMRNAGDEPTFGYSAAEIIGAPIRRLFPPDREDELIARLEPG
jgi:hypothetical protein